MRYAFVGGKYLRARLCCAYAELLQLAPAQQEVLALAVEAIHSYSLTHDDLPALDNDSMRRGKNATHIEFDPATAILTGDALYSFAFETILSDPAIDEAGRCRVAQALASCAGTSGMIYGQMLDLYPVAGPEQRNKNTLKTAKLFSACATLPLSIAAESSKQAADYQTFATGFGELFQLLDDLDDEPKSQQPATVQQAATLSATLTTLLGQFPHNHPVIDDSLATLKERLAAYQ